MKPSTNKQKTSFPLPQKIFFLLSTVYVFLLLCIFPLFFKNSYVDILEAKTSFFILSSFGYLLSCVLLLFCSLFSYGQQGIFDKIKNGILALKHPLYIFSAIFFFSLVCSTFFSENPLLTLKGTTGKLFGSGVLLLCVFVFICISFGFQMHPALLWGCLISNCINFILIILNRFNIDPLHMYDAILASSASDYLGTIGQMNIVSGHICIFLSLFIGLFLYAEAPLSKLLYGIGIVLGVAAGVCSNSDSFFLGLGVCLLCYFWFAFSSKKMLLSFSWIPVLIMVSSLFLQMYTRYAKKEAVWLDLQYNYLEKIGWGSSFFLCLPVILFLFFRTPSTEEKKQKINLYQWRWILFAFIGICILFFLFYLFHVNFRTESGTAGVPKLFLFSDDWGSNRGYVWTRTFSLWKGLSSREKLFGVGPGGFQMFFSEYYMESIEKFGYYFIDAHNEFLQFLVTTGIAGTIGYFGMIFCCIFCCVKQQSKASTVIACTLLTALAQGIVNNPLVFTTPYLFVFMGIYLATASCEQRSRSI